MSCNNPSGWQRDPVCPSACEVDGTDDGRMEGGKLVLAGNAGITGDTGSHGKLEAIRPSVRPSVRLDEWASHPLPSATAPAAIWTVQAVRLSPFCKG